MSDRWEWVPIEPTEEGLAQTTGIPTVVEVDITQWPSGQEGVYLATEAFALITEEDIAMLETVLAAEPDGLDYSELDIDDDQP